jgi:putative FmdB family regulatory protein
MIYEFECDACKHRFDVIKPIKDFDLKHSCPKCEHSETHIVISAKIHHIGAKVQNAEFNHGLGCVVHSKKEREEIAKQRGLIEVGNETPDTLYKESVVKREKEKQKEWDAL